MKTLEVPFGIAYYDPVENWEKIKRHITSQAVQVQLQEDFGRYTSGRFDKAFEPGQMPREFEDHRKWKRLLDDTHEYISYVKHGACHWLANANLRLAQLVLPKRAWRIITSHEHSTVWDGKKLLLDFNFFAFGVPPERAFKLAAGHQLEAGKLLPPCWPHHVDDYEEFSGLREIYERVDASKPVKFWIEVSNWRNEKDLKIAGKHINTAMTAISGKATLLLFVHRRAREYTIMFRDMTRHNGALNEQLSQPLFKRVVIDRASAGTVEEQIAQALTFKKKEFDRDRSVGCVLLEG